MKTFAAILFTGLLSLNAQAQNIASYSASKLQERISNADSIYIVNFWATWCGPCVRELPEFDKLEKKYKDTNVKVLMVSLDFKEDYPAKLVRFIEKKKLQPEVVWLNESNANDFIPKLEPTWEGSIPATLIIDKKAGFRNFREGTVKAEDASKIVDGLIETK